MLRSCCTRPLNRLYHCVLLVVTLYSPKSHRLTFLRSHAERTDPRLIEAWPRDTRFARRCFATVDRAYIGARYSPEYVITGEELAWLVEHAKALLSIVATISAEHLQPEGKPGSWTYDNIVAAETAIEILTQARGMISARLRKIKDEDAAQARTLRAKRREVVTLLRSIRPDDPHTAIALAATWGPRVKDDERFWREL